MLGLVIKFRRIRKGITQFELAKMADLVPSSVSFMEVGKRKVDADELMRIAEVLGTTMDELMQAAKDMENEEIRDNSESQIQPKGLEVSE